MTETLCACGRPLHYSDPHCREMVEQFIADLGENIKITARDRSFMVPRHFLALHGIDAAELASVAEQYGFEEVHINP